MDVRRGHPSHGMASVTAARVIGLRAVLHLGERCFLLVTFLCTGKESDSGAKAHESFCP
jgi:hypothetical protein